VFLLVMAIQMIRSIKNSENPDVKVAKTRPIAAGIILSGSNPYFLLWWATVGLTLAMSAKELGIWAFALFTVIHWLCDLIWLSALSWASFKGSRLLGPDRQKVVLLICSMALIGFGLFFIYNAAGTLIKLL